MSSVQSAPRQRIVGNTLLSAPASSTPLYVFIAGSGNYVGNYPNLSSSTPGYLQQVATFGTLNSVFGAASVGTAPILRDMGKTITAGISQNSGTTIGSVGTFRAVQILNPVTLAAATAQTNFGVNGSVPGTIPSGNAGDDGYNTFYIATITGGVIAQNAVPDNTVGPITGSVL